jgi:flagellar biosynthesis/type III secretory pathway M-ring protein FliF/YscJ
VLEALLFVLVAAALVAFVVRPLREREADADRGEDPRIAELEARKEALYREIRDGEMDRAAGKLAEPEFKRHDAELRREAIEILRELDRIRGQ